MSRAVAGYNISLDSALKQGGFYGSDGTWNSLIKIDGRILRGRVEVLIFKKDTQEVYMYIKNFNKKRYEIPGGSFEKDVPNFIQVQNEANEEARIIVKNLVNSGQHYILLYNKPAGEGNLQWAGGYTEVYVGEYGSKYEGHIDEEDKFDDMYNNGQFYKIRDIYPILSEPHKKIIDSIFPNIEKSEISENMIILRESDNEVHYYPYYTPREMYELGVFNESKNRYSDIEDEAIEWYLEYTDSLVNPDSKGWYKELCERYIEYNNEPSMENKQAVLNLGWNPEVPVTMENVLIASEKTKQRLNNILIEESVYIDESVIFSKDDIVQNIDDYEDGKSNILFITGLSGAGKSTLADELSEQYNAKVVNLDYFQCYNNLVAHRYSNKKDFSWVIVDEYMRKTPKAKEESVLFSSINLQGFKDYFVPFFNWLVKQLEKDKSNKYIIEGIHLMLFIPYKNVKKYPLYCINTSMIRSLVRHWIRDDWSLSDIIKHGYSDLIQFKRWNDQYDLYKDKIS